MNANSSRAAGPMVGGDIDPAGLEHQQAVLFEALRRAGGAPVSYEKLREAGLEFPASVVSELELAGVPIERCFDTGRLGQRRLVGVRLRPADESIEGALVSPPQSVVPSSEPTEDPSADSPTGPRWGEVHVYRASTMRALALAAWALPSGVASAGRAAIEAVSGSGGVRAEGFHREGHTRKRLLAPLALIVAAVVVLIVVLGGSARGGSHRRASVAPRPEAIASAAQAARQAGPASIAPAPPPVTSPPVSLSLATDLDSQGHDLLASGQYGAAVPVLERAVLATGEQVSSCVEPGSPSCLTYAYALYDLGRALRLSGNPAAAVPILQRRLQIDDQRPTVQAELQLARQQVSQREERPAF